MRNNLKKIDEENEEYYKETLEKSLEGKCSVKDIIGFDYFCTAPDGLMVLRKRK